MTVNFLDNNYTYINYGNSEVFKKEIFKCIVLTFLACMLSSEFQ